MKKTIYVVAPNDNLKKIFSNIESIEFTIHLKEIEGEIRCDAIILYGESVSHNQITEIRAWYPELPIFYKIHNETNASMIKNIYTICRAYNVTCIGEKLLDKQVAEEVLKNLLVNEMVLSPRVVSFFGTHSGSGVSTTILSLAKRLAERVEEKVIVLSLNAWDPSDYLLVYKGSYLNDLKIDLKTNTLTEDKLLQAVYYYEKEGFYHLAGNRDIKMQRYYKVNEISNLIELAKRSFGIVLIDGGTHFDNACYAQAYKSAELKFLITTQESKGYSGYWQYIYQQLIEPIEGTPQNYMLIINRYMSDLSLINDKDMQKELNMSLLTTIPDQYISAYIANAQKKLLIDEADSNYKAAINTIATSIIERAKLTTIKEEEEESKPKGIFKFLSKKHY